MDRSRRKAGAREEVLQGVGAPLRLHEHQREALQALTAMRGAMQLNQGPV